MFNLTKVFELIVDRLDDSVFFEEQIVRQGHEFVDHVALDAGSTVVTGFERRGIDESNTVGLLETTALQVDQQENNSAMYKPVTDQPGEFRPQMLADMLDIEIFEYLIS